MNHKTRSDVVTLKVNFLRQIYVGFFWVFGWLELLVHQNNAIVLFHSMHSAKD